MPNTTQIKPKWEEEKNKSGRSYLLSCDFVLFNSKNTEKQNSAAWNDL